MRTKYFNNAGAGLMSPQTYNTILEHMQYEMAIGAYRAANEKADNVAQFYSLSAQMLHANEPSEIAFIDSASRGWNLVMYGLNISSKDVIITLSSEYGTNLLTIYDIAKKTGCSVRVVPCNEQGQFSLADVEKEMKTGGTILAISHVAAQGSIVNPVIEMGILAQKYGIIYIVDGCQAAGQMKADVNEMNCSAYITAGRKWLRGPRGTGILYVKKGSPIRTPQIDLASSDLVFDEKGEVSGLTIRKDAKQFELWEKNIALLLGLTHAVSEFLSMGEESVSRLIQSKADIIRQHISENRNLKLVGQTISPSGIAAFYLTDSEAESKTKAVFENNNLTISIICDWDCPVFFPKDVTSIFRISPHYYTSEEDIKAVCNVIDNL